MTRAAIWISLGALAVLSCATADAAPTARQLDRLLGGIEQVPSADEIRRLGPGTDQALIQYASDAHTSRMRRMRAILALRFVPSSSARGFLRELLTRDAAATDGPDVLDVAAALSALPPYGAEELATLVPYLSHASADVRQSAAASLGVLGVAEALGPLKARLTVETDAGVRLALARAAKALSSPER